VRVTQVGRRRAREIRREQMAGVHAWHGSHSVLDTRRWRPVKREHYADSHSGKRQNAEDLEQVSTPFRPPVGGAASGRSQRRGRELSLWRSHPLACAALLAEARRHRDSRPAVLAGGRASHAVDASLAFGERQFDGPRSLMPLAAATHSATRPREERWRCRTCMIPAS